MRAAVLLLCALACVSSAKPAPVMGEVSSEQTYESLFERYVATQLRAASNHFGKLATTESAAASAHLSALLKSARSYSARTRTSRSAKAAFRHSYLRGRPSRAKRDLHDVSPLELVLSQPSEAGPISAEEPVQWWAVEEEVDDGTNDDVEDKKANVSPTKRMERRMRAHS